MKNFLRLNEENMMIPLTFYNTFPPYTRYNISQKTVWRVKYIHTNNFVSVVEKPLENFLLLYLLLLMFYTKCVYFVYGPIITFAYTTPHISMIECIEKKKKCLCFGVKLLLLLLDGILYHPNTFTNKSKIYLFQSFLQKEFSFIRTVVGGRCLKKGQGIRLFL